MEKVETISIEFCALNYPLGTYFGGLTWLHRLQRFPHLALNPMEKVDTMSIEFDAINYPKKLALVVPRGYTGSRGSLTWP